MEAAKQQVVAAVDQETLLNRLRLSTSPAGVAAVFSDPASVQHHWRIGGVTITPTTGGTKSFSLVLGLLSLAAGLSNAQILISVISVI